MVSIELEGVHRVKAKLASGKRVEYHYAWRGGPLFWKTGETTVVGSVAYIEAFQAAGKAPADRAGKKFREMAIAFQKSGEFTRLKPRTQKDYKKWLAEIDEKYGDAPLDSFNQPEIRPSALRWRDNWTGRQSQYAWSTLQRVVSWGYDRGHLKFHHLRGGGTVYKSNRADIIWTSADLAAFHAVAPRHISRAMTAAVETGLRPGDLINLSRAHIQATDYGRRILIRTRKKERLASIPVTDAMADIIDTTPQTDMLILRTSKGEQWTEGGLSEMVKRTARRAGIRDELRFYDARGTAATRLLLAKVPLSEIAVMMGWSVKTAAHMIETYAAMDPSISDSVLIHLIKSKK